jgi:hypothetical protein
MTARSGRICHPAPVNDGPIAQSSTGGLLKLARFESTGTAPVFYLLTLLVCPPQGIAAGYFIRASN